MSLRRKIDSSGWCDNVTVQLVVIERKRIYKYLGKKPKLTIMDIGNPTFVFFYIKCFQTTPGLNAHVSVTN